MWLSPEAKEYAKALWELGKMESRVSSITVRILEEDFTSWDMLPYEMTATSIEHGHLTKELNDILKVKVEQTVKVSSARTSFYERVEEYGISCLYIYKCKLLLLRSSVWLSVSSLLVLEHNFVSDTLCYLGLSNWYVHDRPATAGVLGLDNYSRKGCD